MKQTLIHLGYSHSGSLSWKWENSPNSNHQSEKQHILWIKIGNNYDFTKKCSYSQTESSRQQFLIKDGSSVSVFSDIPVKSVSYPVVGGRPGDSYWLITLIVRTCMCARVCVFERWRWIPHDVYTVTQQPSTEQMSESSICFIFAVGRNAGNNILAVLFELDV